MEPFGFTCSLVLKKWARYLDLPLISFINFFFYCENDGILVVFQFSWLILIGVCLVMVPDQVFRLLCDFGTFWFSVCLVPDQV